jgi:hypothetical protein
VVRRAGNKETGSTSYQVSSVLEIDCILTGQRLHERATSGLATVIERQVAAGLRGTCQAWFDARRQSKVRTVIEPIGDNPDGTCDFDETELNWADCPVLPRSDMLAVIERHKALNGRAVNLFTKKGQPRSDLLEYQIGPHLYLSACVTM